jgi:hypothetical protein
MASRFWTALGVLLTVAMVVLSALINYSFGHSLGTTETNGRIFGAVSVVAVGVMAVLPLRISAHWEAGRNRRAVVGGAMFGILVAFAVAGSIGFGIQNRSQIAGSGETLAAQLKDEIADRDQAVSRLKGLSEDQPQAAISAKIDAAKKDRRWEQTQACTNATATASRDFCQEVDGLRARLDLAATAGVLREKIERLNKSIEKLRKQGAGQVTDAQSAGFARMFQVERDVAQTGLSVLLALVIESVCCFGLLVIAGAHAEARIGAGPSLPEWIGEWLTERAEPHPGTCVSFSELEADFRRWVEGRPVPKLSSRKFTGLIRAACEEVGLSVEGQKVAGLRLTSVHRMLAAA